MTVDYDRSVEIYERMKKKDPVVQDLKCISQDVTRTFQDEPFFKTKGGQEVLTELLSNVSKHSSSSGYT
jgi:hypothetical protein